MPEIQCDDFFKQEPPFADGSKRYTKRFRKLVLSLSRHMTIKAVAAYLRVGWDLVKEIQKSYLKRHFSRPCIRKLKRIAIDEIYMGPRMGYLTVVLDLRSGEVIHVGEGKSGEALEAFWKRLKQAHVKLEVVATDMGPAFIKSAQDHQPQAINVVDHFHVIKLYNEKLTKQRRELQNKAETEEQREVVKGVRWLLLMGDQKLKEKPQDAQQRLQRALEINEPLSIAYYLKEELGMLWKQPDKGAADTALTDWIEKANASGIRLLKSFARTLARLRDAILAYYDFDGISSGPIEGANNKIKTIHKTAYGFRDLEFFKLKILSMHLARKDAFSG